MYSDKQIEKACSVNFIEFMLDIHNDRIMFKDGCYRDTAHDSLVFYEDHFYRHSNRTRGNQINYLKEYLGYNFQEAMKELLNYSKINKNRNLAKKTTDNQCKKFYEPVQNTLSKEKIYSYLMNRKISKNTIDILYKSNKLYPATVKNNGDAYVCFANREMDFYILRNTNIDGIQKLIVSNVYGGFWYWCPVKIETDLLSYLTNGKAIYPKNLTVYVCESPIDAISLYELRSEKAIYTAMAGLKDISLKQIQERFSDHRTVLAVDSDNAGNRFCKQFPELERIIPDGKDWNEMLINKS